MERLAYFSQDGLYRYWLSRCWDRRKGQLCVVMLNPSTADHRVDDPTIRAIMWIAAKWGYGGFVVVNLCAYCSPKPKVIFRLLRDGQDVIGPENILHIRNMVSTRVVLCAWGTNAAKLPYQHVERVKTIIQHHALKSICIKMTKDGHPQHPLYADRNTQPKDFTWTN